MMTAQLAIVGAGPAGLSAAIEAARAGVRVSVFDENGAPGGQLIKQIHKFFGSRAHKAGFRGLDIGTQLLQEAVALNVDIHLNTVVWGIFEGNHLGISRNGRIGRVSAEKVLLATGASENVLVFEGWTLPGVLGAGAAQTMMNLHRVLPGKRAVMVGSGNVGLIVAYQLLQAGADVVAVVEAASQIGGYSVHADKLKRMGVPIHTSHTVKKVFGQQGVEAVVLAEVDRAWHPIPGTEKELPADTVCIATGLSPLAELAWIAGARFAYVSELGGHVPLHSRDLETTVKNLYVAGDITGIEEASTAMEEGKLAGTEIARSLGRLNVDEAEARKKTICGHLAELRKGPFGDFRLSAKESLFSQYQWASDQSKRPEGRSLLRASSRPRSPGAPRPELYQGPAAVIECPEEIPCNPCVEACASGAIQIEGSMTALPVLDREKCNGCGVCIPFCPGLAIFVLDMGYSEHEALIKLPYEFRPLPEKGEEVVLFGREGERLGLGRVQSVLNPPAFDRTPVIALLVGKEIAPQVRHFKRSK